MAALKDIFGICIYNWYGAGGHQSPGPQPFAVQGDDLINASGKWISTVRAVSKFKLHRAFVDNWAVVPEISPPFTVKTEPTEQNFYFDSFFKLQKANGITNIWSASGCFDWYKTALGANSQRKTACYNPTMMPTDPKAWEDLATFCGLIAAHYKDAGLLDYIQILNEWDFRWNVPHILLPEEYAAGFKVCYEAIRAVSPTQKIMTGCTLTPDMTTARSFFSAFDKLFINEGKTPPRDFVYTFNNYIRTQSNNQGDGVGATAEEVDRYGQFFKPLNDLCTELGLEGFACTESGWNSSPSTSVSAMKNKAPTLESYTLEEAQGILAIRAALIFASLPKCKGVTFYHCKDGYEAEPFTYHGFNYDKDFGGKEDWSAKPARTLAESFLEKYGNAQISNFRKVGNLYGVDVTLNGAMQTLVWTDKLKSGNQDALPKPGTLVTPPASVMLNVKNKKLQFGDAPFLLRHADSPEARLKPGNEAAFKTEAEQLAAIGMNCITATMRGDDVKEVFPWVTSSPSSGIDTAKLQKWHDQLKYFIDQCNLKGYNAAVILYLGERTNFNSIASAQYKQWIDAMAPIFADIAGNCIFGWEELFNGTNEGTMAFADDIGGYLKSKLPGCLVMVHNNPGQKPWSAPSAVVDLICIQETSIPAMGVSATDAFNKGYAAHLHEPFNGFRISQTQSANLASLDSLLAQAPGITSGYGIFASDYDLQPPDASKLAHVYTALVQKTSGTIPNPPPQPTHMEIRISANSSKTPFEILTNGTMKAPGNYFIYAEPKELKTPVTFQLLKNGVIVIPQRNESGYPYDMNGGPAFNFGDGEYTLIVKSGTETATINFDIGVVTPPPAKEPVSEIFVADGKVHFVTATKTYSLELGAVNPV